MITVNIISLLLLSCVTGEYEYENQTIFIPKRVETFTEDDEINKGYYCYRFTWLGASYDKNLFVELKNKTCNDVFDNNDAKLCVDPMVVTETGGKPDIDYIRKYYFKEATCKLSEDRVCAKYTIYYNGVASHVVRYCTRIDVESEGPLQSGCLTAKNGSFHYEVCACRSGLGPGGICNATMRNQSSIFKMLSLLMISFLVYNRIC